MLDYKKYTYSLIVAELMIENNDYTIIEVSSVDIYEIKNILVITKS